jgi:hypothetical protein
VGGIILKTKKGTTIFIKSLAMDWGSFLLSTPKYFNRSPSANMANKGNI